jgi:hypothetical protein
VTLKRLKYAASNFSNSARREQNCPHRMAQDQLEEANKVDRRVLKTVFPRCNGREKGRVGDATNLGSQLRIDF